MPDVALGCQPERLALGPFDQRLARLQLVQQLQTTIELGDVAFVVAAYSVGCYSDLFYLQV